MEIKITLLQIGTKINTPGKVRNIGDNNRKFWDVEDISGKMVKMMSLEDEVGHKKKHNMMDKPHTWMIVQRVWRMRMRQ